MALVKWKENGYLKKQGDKYADMLAVFALFAGIAYFLWVIKLPPMIFVIVLPIFILAYVVIIKHLWVTGRRYVQGLDSEFAVTKELCKLPDAYFGFHDIQVP